MSETADPHRSLARFAHVLASLGNDVPLPARLCEASRLMLAGDGASVTLDYTTASRLMIHATDDLAAALDDLQEVLGQGPSLQAAVSGSVVVAELDGAASPGWGLFTERVVLLPFEGTIVAVPLIVGDAVVGVLTVHRRGAGTEDDRAVGRLLGATVGSALVQEPLETEAAAPLDPWTRRAEVHQATGMIVAQVGVPAADALALLKGQAFARNMELRDVAREIVRRRINFRDFTIEGD